MPAVRGDTMPNLADVWQGLGLDRPLDRLRPDQETVVRRAVPLIEAGPGDMTSCGVTARNPSGRLKRTSATLVIVDERVPMDRQALLEAGVEVVLRSPSARLTFLGLRQAVLHPASTAGDSSKCHCLRDGSDRSDRFRGPIVFDWRRCDHRC